MFTLFRSADQANGGAVPFAGYFTVSLYASSPGNLLQTGPPTTPTPRGVLWNSSKALIADKSLETTQIYHEQKLSAVKMAGNWTAALALARCGYKNARSTRSATNYIAALEIIAPPVLRNRRFAWADFFLIRQSFVCWSRAFYPAAQAQVLLVVFQPCVACKLFHTILQVHKCKMETWTGNINR